MKVIFVCSTIGIVHRGYEKAVTDFYTKLKENTNWTVKLIKGAGEATPNEIVVPRSLPPGLIVKTAAKLRRRPPAWVYDNLYAQRILPTLKAEKPDVVYYMEMFLGNALYYWRNKQKLGFKLLFANGALLEPATNQYDHIQQLLPFYKTAAVAAGVPANIQTVLPHGFDIEPQYTPLPTQNIAQLRQKYNLPTQRHILLNVGAINYGHKRTDYVINEVAAIAPHKRPFLLILGQMEPDAKQIIELAKQKLGEENFLATTVPGHQVMDYYHISDSFVLGSLFEGQPLVLTEALTAGLPIFAHKYKVTDNVGGHLMMRDNFAQQGAFTKLFTDFTENGAPSTPQQRHAFAYQTFSWQALLPQYIEMVKKAATQ